MGFGLEGLLLMVFWIPSKTGVSFKSRLHWAGASRAEFSDLKMPNPPCKGFGCRVQCLRFRVSSSGCRFQGLGYEVQGLRFRVWALGLSWLDPGGFGLRV